MTNDGAECLIVDAADNLLEFGVTSHFATSNTSGLNHELERAQMKMVPDSCSPRTSSAAERRVFSLLQRTELTDAPDTVCMHSLNLSQHDYKRVAEVDFVLFSRHFLIALEVKGGGVSCQSGIWTFTDRYGEEHRKSEGPFQQARSGMYSLVDRLQRRVGSPIRRMPIGYGVALPDTDFRVESVEWDPQMVLDAAKFQKSDDLVYPLEDLIEYWTSKSTNPQLLSTTQLGEVSRLLRPDFERLPSLRNRADQMDAALESLTQEQYRGLDIISDSDRIVCSGGAGTGKTFLAAEIARREADSGRTVAFLTSTSLQRAFVESRLGSSNVDVVTPNQLVDSNFDVMIIDEGQDLLNFEDLAAIDRSLKGGLEEGRWRFFLDSNHQTGLIGKFEPDALDYLLKGCVAVPAKLRHNCRNTRDVVVQTKLLTGADLGAPTAGHGPPVSIDYFDSDEEQLLLLESEIERLMDGGVAPGEISILSPVPLTDSIASRCRPARRKRMTALDQTDAADWPISRISFSTIPLFKGLENQFILVVDIAELTSETDLNMLYVAMSRARSGLWLGLPRTLEDRVEALSLQHRHQVMKDLNNEL